MKRALVGLGGGVAVVGGLVGLSLGLGSAVSVALGWIFTVPLMVGVPVGLVVAGGHTAFLKMMIGTLVADVGVYSVVAWRVLGRQRVG